MMHLNRNALEILTGNETQWKTCVEDRVVSGTTGGQRQTDVYIGSTVELSCNLAAGTTGRIQWSRDRGLLPPTAFKTAENKLELTNVQPSDAGRYLCEVTGRQGTSSEYVLLNVKSKPTFSRARGAQEAVGRRTESQRGRPARKMK